MENKQLHAITDYSVHYNEDDRQSSQVVACQRRGLTFKEVEEIIKIIEPSETVWVNRHFAAN